MSYKATFLLTGLQNMQLFSIPFVIEYDYEPPKFPDGPTFVGIMSVAVTGAEQYDIGMLVTPEAYDFFVHEINKRMEKFPPSEEQRAKNAENMRTSREGVEEWAVYNAISPANRINPSANDGEPPTLQ